MFIFTFFPSINKWGIELKHIESDADKTLIMFFLIQYDCKQILKLRIGVLTPLNLLRPPLTHTHP